MHLKYMYITIYIMILLYTASHGNNGNNIFTKVMEEEGLLGGKHKNKDMTIQKKVIVMMSHTIYI